MPGGVGGVALRGVPLSRSMCFMENRGPQPHTKNSAQGFCSEGTKNGDDKTQFVGTQIVVSPDKDWPRRDQASFC
jgi:hypothetical protein